MKKDLFRAEECIEEMQKELFSEQEKNSQLSHQLTMKNNMISKLERDLHGSKINQDHCLTRLEG
jgi:hypothetical protein